jgi:hypothetical protein
MAGKGDRHRSISKEFKDNFDKIKFDPNKKSRFERPKQRVENKSARVFGDIEPYKAVGGDVAGQMITSRSHHREFLRRNNFIEVGTEKNYFFKHNGKSHDNPTKDW